MWLQHACVDRTGHYIAVAGRYGLAHCAPPWKRWKIFGNITQERDMSVSGGLCWWREFIIAACFNHYESREEVGSSIELILSVPGGIISKPTQTQLSW